MNLFRTTVNAGVSKHTFSLSDRILTLGSCFADSIGSRLIQNKTRTLANPFGVIYNPHSIHKVLRYAIFNETVTDHTFLQHGDVHLNYDFHSGISSLSKQELQRSLSNIIGSVHYSLKNTQWLMITYGTSWVYERSDYGEIVANCHKQPSALFRKSLLTQKKIIESFEAMYKELKILNPDIRIILTVSPVRHIKETLELNSVSKSILRIACHTLCQTFSDVEYFPAYELQLDDLRDYRFYKSDMIHPSPEAEDYIWQQFSMRYFNSELLSFIEKWTIIQQALAHNAFHPQSAAHQSFLRDTLRKLEQIQTVVDVREEILKVKGGIVI